MGPSVCASFRRHRSLPFICQGANAAAGVGVVVVVGGFYCEMDASFNGLESEADREGGNAKADVKKGGGSSNGIQNRPIMFKSKSFQEAFYMLANLLCFRGD